VAGAGLRVLIMRLWPRGIRKDRVDVWLKELGPIVPLLRDFRAGKVDWNEYRRRYLQGLGRAEAREAVEQVLGVARRQPVTLLCGCPDESRCHRSLLHDYLVQRIEPDTSREA
jgi:uncharacterized protein YeaO (DUF488 family)